MRALNVIDAFVNRREKNALVYILLTATLSFIVAFTVVVIELNLAPSEIVSDHSGGYEGLSIKVLVIKVIIVPFIENFICLLVFLSLLERMFKSWHFPILITAFLFSFGHIKNHAGIYHVLAVFIPCFLTTVSYWKWRDNRLAGFCVSWAVHGLHNFFFQLLHFVPASLLIF
jgi:membrane protease YdiL (CAAX protease family)